MITLAIAIASGWVMVPEKDMMSGREKAFAFTEQNGARLTLICDVDTNYQTAVLVQRTRGSDISRFGSTFVTYKFDDNGERSSHWINSNSDSMLLTSGKIEVKKFVQGVMSANTLKFRGRADNLISVDIQFDLTKGRENLADFARICSTP